MRTLEGTSGSNHLRIVNERAKDATLPLTDKNSFAAFPRVLGLFLGLFLCVWRRLGAGASLVRKRHNAVRPLFPAPRAEGRAQHPLLPLTKPLRWIPARF
jgi:hypothetical protein